MSLQYILEYQLLLKIRKKVEYDEQLIISYRPDREDKADRQQKYSLKGVLVHIGNHISSGHYEAYVKDTVGKNAWYMIDDACVESVGVNTVLNREAYMLFYEKLSCPELDQDLCKNLPLKHTRKNRSFDLIFEQNLQN